MRLPARSAGLTAQLQALRKALYHKYVQEVAALNEQHNRELKRLREEREPEWKEECQEERGEKEQNLKDWERVEEEVAKVRDCAFCVSIQFLCLVSINKTGISRQLH